ncbi:Hypothetical protein POVN_LOCUS86 [uncultured virus]|nr:Hypothetical protein POVN_LOCUS86 [uncultured virus]
MADHVDAPTDTPSLRQRKAIKRACLTLLSDMILQMLREPSVMAASVDDGSYERIWARFEQVAAKPVATFPLP